MAVLTGGGDLAGHSSVAGCACAHVSATIVSGALPSVLTRVRVACVWFICERQAVEGGGKGGGEFGENVLGKVFASVTREMYEKVIQTVYSPIYRGKRFSAL